MQAGLERQPRSAAGRLVTHRLCRQPSSGEGPSQALRDDALAQAFPSMTIKFADPE